jgi:hypothetical protein
MRLRFVTAWGLVAVLGGATRSEARPALDPDGLARLARYDVLSFTAPGGGGVDVSRAVGVFDATPDEVYRTATDYGRLSEFAPRVQSSTVLDRQGEARALVMLVADLPWPVSSAWVQAQFDIERPSSGVFRIRFAQVRGSMRRYFGSILIEPWRDGKSSVTYEQLAEPDTLAPRRLVNGRLRDAAARYVHALRQRVNELHRLGRLHPQQPPTPDLRSALAGTRRTDVVESLANRR